MKIPADWMSRLRLLIVLVFLPLGLAADGTGTYLVNLIKNADCSIDKDHDNRPDWWVKHVDPANGFHSYGRVRMGKGTDGSTEVLMETNGTNVVLQNHAMTFVPVDASSSYHLEVDVQNEKCGPRDVKASIGVLWLDKDKKILREDWVRERHEGRDGERPSNWLHLEQDIDIIPEKTRWARVRFGLVHGEENLSGVSVKGRGWFKGLSFTRRPRIKLIPEHDERIFPNNDKHKVLFDIEGLEQGLYHCFWEVENFVGKKVDSGDYAISTERGERESERDVVLKLNRRKGWFRLKMRLEARGEREAVIANDVLIFGVGEARGELGALHVSEQLGLDIQTAKARDKVDTVGDLVEFTRARHVTLSLWNNEFTTKLPLAKTYSGELVGRMNEANVRITAVLGHIPLEVKGDFLGSNLFNLLSSRRSNWEPLLDYTGKNYSEIDQWIIGSEFDTSIIEQGTLASPMVRDVRRLMNIPGIRLGLPVGDILTQSSSKSIYPRVFDKMELFTFHQPAGGRDASDYFDQKVFDNRLLLPGEQFGDRKRPDRHVRLDLKDQSHKIEERLESLVFGTIHLLNQGADRVNVKLQPPRMGLVDRNNDFLPELFAFRTLTEVMAPLKILGEIDLPSGSRNLILEFEDARLGKRLAMLLWNKDGPVTEDIFLGKRLKIVDLMGNRDALPVVRNANHIPVRPIPRFLVDLDEELMRTRLSVTLSRPLIDARVQDMRESVEITNFLKEDLSGELEITMPDGWELLGSSKSRIRTMKTTDRRIVGFRIRPDAFETTNKDVKLTLNFTFDGNTRPPMKIFKRFKFRSRSIKMELTFPDKRDQNTKDIKVMMSVTNVGGGQIDLVAYNATLGREEDERFLGLLKPGGARGEPFVIKRDDIVNGRVTLGVRENGGFGRFVNRRLAIVGGIITDVE